MIRRYAPIKPSRGTVIPQSLRSQVRAADKGCVGPRVGMPGDCFGGLEIDHVRASGGIGMKSPTEFGNCVLLCSTHHRVKTNSGKTWRPVLVEYIEHRDGR